MAVLPTVDDLGPRPAPRSRRAIARVSAADAPARAMEQLGQTVEGIGDQIYERETTAAAKERDAYVSDEIRKLLYDPQTGFANLSGKAAVDARSATLARIERLRELANDGLAKGAQRKLEGSLRQRLDTALGVVDRHTAGERRTWINGASEARMFSATQDAAFDLGQTQTALAAIDTELQDIARREGWDGEKLKVERQKRYSEVYSSQINRMAAADPIAAMEYLRENQDKMLASDVARFELNLTPDVKRELGRRQGEQAFYGAGDMSAALSRAQDTMGMNETQQREALAAYMRDGGVNLDPAVTAWCAGIMNAWLSKAGVQGTGSLMARSFLDWGVNVDTSPKRGDVVVLARGRGPEGHVGFFMGYDEQGNVLVLGGNQSDSVNVAPYAANRILGFRRVPATEGEQPRGIAPLLEIEDPIERRAAIEEYNFRVSVTEGERKARHAAAEQAAFAFVEQGNDPADLPYDVREQLGREEMAGLYSYAEKRAKGVAPQTDWIRYSELMETYARAPETFANIPPATYRDKLSDADFKKMLDLRTGIQQGTHLVDPPAVSSVMSTATAALNGAGFDKQDDAEVWNQFQGRITNWLVSNPDKAADPVELQAQIDRLLAPIVLNPPGAFNEQSAAAFQIDYDGDPLDPDDDITPDMILDGTLRIGGQEPDRALIEAFATAFEQRMGYAPTVQELVEGLIGFDAFTSQFRTRYGRMPSPTEIAEGLSLRY